MAELLGGDGGGVIGFDAVSGHVDAGWEEEEEEEEVPRGTGTEFQVVMKQLGKRDSTTKLKVIHMKPIVVKENSLPRSFRREGRAHSYTFWCVLTQTVETSSEYVVSMVTCHVKGHDQ